MSLFHANHPEEGGIKFTQKSVNVYHSARHHIPEAPTLHHRHLCENLRSTEQVSSRLRSSRLQQLHFRVGNDTDVYDRTVNISGCVPLFSLTD